MSTVVEGEKNDDLVKAIERLPARTVDPWKAVGGAWLEPRSDAPTVREAVETVKAMVVGLRVQRITWYPRVDEKFKTNTELVAAVSEEPIEVKVVDAGGGRLAYAAYNDGSVGYVVAKPNLLLFACTCGSGLLCRHSLGAFWHALPELMARVTGVHASMWRQRLQWALDRFAGSTGAAAAILYYLLRAVHEAGVKVKVVTVPAPRPSEAVVQQTGFTGPVEEARKQLLEVLKALGLRGLGVGEWPEAIVYALVASADYGDPPTVIHVVGDIGTFKTRGSMLAARLVRVPYLVVECSCDPREAHRTLYETLEALGVPVDPGEAGGVVRDVVAQEEYYRAKISIPHLAALGIDVTGVTRRLEELGFKVRRVREPMRLAVLDPAKAQAFEDYRVRYQPTAVGVLRVHDLFDNHVLVVDEGSRNPQALELLLTRLSISDVHESLRIVFITDNIEPFVEAFSDPRLAPLGDRVIRVMTRGVVPPGRYDVRPPEIDYDALLLARRALEAIQVQAGLIHAARGVAYALQYVLVQDGDDYILVDRAQSRVEGLDALEGLNVVFKAGGRFEYHTVMLARFYAFLAGRREATLEDVAKALRLTVRSRLVVPAETYLEYKEVVAEVEDRVERMLHHLRPQLPRLDSLRLYILHEKWEAAEAEAKTLVEHGLQGGEKLLAFYAALSVVEEGLAEKGVPPKGGTLKRLAWAVLAAKGDPSDYRMFVPRGYRGRVRRVHGGSREAE